MSTKLVDMPTAPASRQARSTAAISAISSAVAARRASSPMHVQAQHGVADERGDVDGEVGRHRLDQAVEALAPAPVDAAVERFGGHLLDQPEHAREAVALRLADRRHAQRAVAGDHGGDAVLDRREHQRVEQQLGVEVGVRVDEARGDDVAAGVDDPLGRHAVERPADADDAPVVDADVAEVAGQAGAVDDQSVADDEVHGVAPVRGRRRRCVDRRRSMPSCLMDGGQRRPGPADEVGEIGDAGAVERAVDDVAGQADRPLGAVRVADGDADLGQPVVAGVERGRRRSSAHRRRAGHGSGASR